MIGITVYVVSDAVVADIRNDKQILTADGFVENSLAFTGSETGTFYIGQIAAFDIAVKSRVTFYFVVIDASAKGNQLIVYFSCKFFCGRQSHDLKRRYGHCIFQFVCISHDFLRNYKFYTLFIAFIG